MQQVLELPQSCLLWHLPCHRGPLHLSKDSKPIICSGFLKIGKCKNNLKNGVYQDQNQNLVVWPSCLAAASTPLVVIITAGVQVGRRRAAGGGGELGASALVLAELPEFVLLESRCPPLHLAQEEQRAAE